MAAATQIESVTITVNDIPVQVPKGELIVESVKRIGLEIPIFCYHPRMKAVGMCRMCLVEVGTKQPDGSVRKMPKPQAACTLPATEGLAIYTDSEMVHRDRRGVLEFLLINHPLDCPICDRGGECPLQNNTLFYGPSTSRFVELKRHLPKAFPLSRYVTLDLERCIQCGRCVRFTEEISGDSQLAFRFRGASMQPSTFELTDFDSKFSGNVIEICPVGALTSTRYRFRARPWDLQTQPAICTVCSNGCNVWFDYRVDRMVRINGRTNEAVNEEWTCDRGKFGHDFYNSDKRTATPLARRGDLLAPVEWAEAYTAVLRAFAGSRGNSVAALAGCGNSNEDLYLLQRLFRRDFGSNNLDHRFTNQLPGSKDDWAAKLGIKAGRLPIAEYERQKAVLIFASSLADEEPILFLRIRKAWFQNGCRVVVASEKPTDADNFAEHVLRYRGGTAADLAKGLAAAAGISGADSRYTPERTEGLTGVAADSIRAAAALLKEGVAPIVATRGIYDLEDSQEIVESLAALGAGYGGSLNLYARETNEQGALELGILPDAANGAAAEPGLGTHGILQGCIDGTVKALWLAGVDPILHHPDPDLARRAIESVDFLVVQGDIETEAFAYASVVLPSCAPAERDGTYTNLEGRVQRLARVLPPRGQAKPAWRIYEELALRVQPETPLFNANGVFQQIRESVPAFAHIDLASMPAEGALLKS